MFITYKQTLPEQLLISWARITLKMKLVTQLLMAKKITQVCIVAVAALLSGCASLNDSADVAANHNAAALETDRTRDTTAPGAINATTDSPGSEEQNIAALIRSNPDLSTLARLIRSADMVSMLESSVGYTVFAPNNEAFAALPAGMIDNLMLPNNKPELTRILQAHVLPEKVMSYELKDKLQVQTIQSEEVTIQVDDRGIVIGGARIITPDIEASNGVMHVIDMVMLPSQE